MIKKLLIWWDDFFYKVLVKNVLKTSRLGYGSVVTGAESGENFEHMYNNKPQGKWVIGKYVDKVLLNLPAVHATRGRKEDVKKILWNEIYNNQMINKKTKVLDLASGGARYLRELKEEHNKGLIESICIDKNEACVKLGESLVKQEGVRNIRFFRGDIFHLEHLRRLSSNKKWQPNVIISSGLFIYFDNQMVERMIKEIYQALPQNGLFIFSSYENLNTRKLMRKTASVSSGEEWILHYRKPDHWRSVLYKLDFKDVQITRDQWLMNNVCSARK